VEQVCGQLEQLRHDLAVDEIMIQDLVTDPTARLRSYELLAEAMALREPPGSTHAHAGTAAQAV
jgi:hypothetical protein